jgi:Na+:H+ antiporter, NhaA family
LVIPVGLVIGKQLGVTLFAWLAVRSGVSELPSGIGWRHVYGVTWLAGIGFTMSLFITDLAFSDGSLVDAAKFGILVASLIAGLVGWTILRTATSSPTDEAYFREPR